jgi:hypothetical protein
MGLGPGSWNVMLSRCACMCVGVRAAHVHWWVGGDENFLLLSKAYMQILSIADFLEST